MGWSGSTTSTTELPPMSEQEKNLLNLVSDTLLPNYLREAGYDVKTINTTFETSDTYKSLNKKLTSAQENLAKLTDGKSAYEIQRDSQQIQQARAAIDQAEKQISEARSKFVPSTQYETRKLENPELEAVRAKYGEDSQQYKDLKKQYTAKEIDDFKKQQAIYDTFVEKTQKFLNGDFSITKSQEALIQKNMAPVKAAVENLFKNTKEEFDAAYGDFKQQADSAGLSTRQALGYVGEQIEKTGKSMEDALKTAVSTREALLKNGIDDYTGEITKRVASNAAALGRDPNDPEFTADIADMVAKQVKDGQLNLADMEAQGMLAIKERTGSGLEQVARTQAEGNINLQQQRGGSLIDIEKDISNMRFQQGAGMVPTMLSAGVGAGEYDTARAQQRLTNASSAYSLPMNFAGFFQGDRAAQPITTQTQNFGMGDFIGAGLGIASAGANIYGASETRDIFSEWMRRNSY